MDVPQDLHYLALELRELRLVLGLGGSTPSLDLLAVLRLGLKLRHLGLQLRGLGLELPLEQRDGGVVLGAELRGHLCEGVREGLGVEEGWLGRGWRGGGRRRG